MRVVPDRGRLSNRGPFQAFVFGQRQVIREAAQRVVVFLNQFFLSVFDRCPEGFPTFTTRRRDERGRRFFAARVGQVRVADRAGVSSTFLTTPPLPLPRTSFTRGAGA